MLYSCPAIMKQIAWNETSTFSRSPNVYIRNLLNKNFNLCGKSAKIMAKFVSYFCQNGTEMAAFWLLEKISAYWLAKRARFKIKNSKDDMSRHQSTNVAMQIPGCLSVHNVQFLSQNETKQRWHVTQDKRSVGHSSIQCSVKIKNWKLMSIFDLYGF